MSIKTYILAFIGVLVAAALASAATVMLVEFRTLAKADHAQRLIAAFDGVLRIQANASRERGYANARLFGQASEDEGVQRRKETSDAFETGIKLLDAAAPESQSSRELKQIRDEFMAARAAVMGKLVANARQPSVAAAYVGQMIGLMQRLDAVADSVERRANADAGPLARSYVTLARVVGILRDQAGRRATRMTQLAAATSPIRFEAGEAFGELAGEVHSVWDRVEQLAIITRQAALSHGKQPPPDLDAAIAETHAIYFDVLEPGYRETMAAARAGTPGDVETLRRRQVDGLVKMGAIRTTALKHAALAIADEKRDACFSLAEAAVLLLAVGAVSVLAVLFLRRRVIAPMTSLTHIVSRLAHNHREDEVPELQRTDEIGGLARAIETLRQALETASHAERERLTMELQLRQAQKLEALGTLAGGIAHEINTPVQYVGDNIRFLETSFAGLAGLVDSCSALRSAVADDAHYAELAAAAARAEEAADLGFLRDEIPAAIAQSLDGIDRIRQIVLAVKEFSHPDVKELTPLDLNRAVETTVTVSRNQWKYVAELTTDLAPDLPLVPCRGGEINQVILNLVVNAAHAIEAKDAGVGQITVTSRVRDGWAEIKVRDSGTGMSPELIERIFDPFFTTKEPGKGTGQGLAICHSIVVQKHGGAILVDSVPGEGTAFTVRLPLEPPPELGGELDVAA